MSNSEQSATVYKISVDDGNYLELRENIKGVTLIRCYVTKKEYEDIFLNFKKEAKFEAKFERQF